MCIRFSIFFPMLAHFSRMHVHRFSNIESWVYGYDVETKAQSSQWKHTESPRPKKARQVRSNVKILFTVFFDYHGVEHQEFLPQGCTVNKEYYLEVMHRLREAI